MGFKCENCSEVFCRRIELIIHNSKKQCDRNILRVEPSDQDVPSDIAQKTEQNDEQQFYAPTTNDIDKNLEERALFMVVNLNKPELRNINNVSSTGHEKICIAPLVNPDDITAQVNDEEILMNFNEDFLEMVEDVEIVEEEIFEEETVEEGIVEEGIVEEGIFEEETVEEAPASSKKKRKRNPISVADRKKIKEEQLKNRHPVQPPCNVLSCKKKCIEKISEERRLELNKMYWGLTYAERCSFILGACDRNDPKRRTAGASNVRKSTFTYKLKDSTGCYQEVCKVFFLTILGYNRKNDKILTTVLSRTPRESITPKPDLRGKTPCKHRGPWDEISEHVDSYNPEISHYRRQHAPKRKYLPSDITIKSMHSDFLEKCPQFKDQVSYEQYRKVVKSKNISFAKLGHEECEDCEEFKLHPHGDKNKDPSCDICQEWEEHIEKASKSRAAYKTFSENVLPDETICFTCDLQKIIMLPRMDTFKRVLFLKRLIAYNETYAPVGKCSKFKPLLCVWHEAITGRNKEELVSTLYRFLKEYRDYRVIHLWMDNCSSQNKNWCLYTFLVNIVNCDEISASEINLWYFEPGHSFMAADAVHHTIELALKHQGKTYDFDDFVSACKVNGKNVVEMKVGDFLKWEDGSSKEKLKNPARVKLTEATHVKAQRGKFTLQYKTSYQEDEEYKTLDFLKKKLMMKKSCKIPPSLQAPRGFDAQKRDKLIKDLDGILPENRKGFWTNLPVSQP